MPFWIKPLYYRRRPRQLWYKDQYPYHFLLLPQASDEKSGNGQVFLHLLRCSPISRFHQCSILTFHSPTTDANIIFKVDRVLKQITPTSRRMLTFFIKPFQCRSIHVTEGHKAWFSHFAWNVHIRVRHKTWYRARSVQFTTGHSVFLRSKPFWSDNDLFRGTFATKFCINLHTR